MGWGNAANVITTSTDAGTDSPAVARSHIKQSQDELIAVINGRGAVNGVASLDADTKVPLAQLPQTPTSRFFVDGTSGGPRTWTVPAGVTRVRITVVGAGGGGGYTSEGTGGDDGGGAGAGGTAVKVFECVPGSDFTYSVGLGGAGADNTADGDGAAGGLSECTSPASATPASTRIYGNGGDKGYGPPDRFGGAGGQAGNSTTPTDTDTMRFDGGAGISGGTRGGAGGSSSRQGGLAGANGSGGGGYVDNVYGGGGGFGSGHGNHAFNGSDGCVLFEW